MTRSLVACPSCDRPIGYTRPSTGAPLIRLRAGISAVTPEDAAGVVRIRCPCGHELPWKGDVALRPSSAMIGANNT